MRRGWGFGARGEGAPEVPILPQVLCGWWHRVLPRPEPLAPHPQRRLRRRSAPATNSRRVLGLETDEQAISNRNDRRHEPWIMRCQLIERPDATGIARLIVRVDRGAVEKRVIAQQQPTGPEQ